MLAEVCVGGLIGALATYILMRGNDIAEKILNRSNRHRTALVKLEQIYCENLDIIYRNIDNIEKFILTIKNASKIGAIPWFFGKFHTIVYDKTVLIDLTTIDFMNDILSLNIDYARTNSDMDNIMDMYDKLKPSLAQSETAEKFLGYLDELARFLKEDLDKKTEETLAKVQTLLTFKGPIIVRFIMLFMQKKAYTDKFVKLYPEILRKVKEGRAKVTKESQKRLDELKRN